MPRPEIVDALAPAFRRAFRPAPQPGLSSSGLHGPCRTGFREACPIGFSRPGSSMPVSLHSVRRVGLHLCIRRLSAGPNYPLPAAPAIPQRKLRWPASSALRSGAGRIRRVRGTGIRDGEEKFVSAGNHPLSRHPRGSAPLPSRGSAELAQHTDFNKKTRTPARSAEPADPRDGSGADPRG